MAGLLSAMAESLEQLFIARLSVGLVVHYTLVGSETQTKPVMRSKVWDALVEGGVLPPVEALPLKAAAIWRR